MKNFLWGFAKIAVFAIPVLLNYFPQVANLTVGALAYGVVHYLEAKFNV